MKYRVFFTFAPLVLAAFQVIDISAAELPKPSPQQYAWHEQERIMFVCLDPATWEGREYDNHSMPLSAINPRKLDTDQWCRAAKLWGAKEILFVAKHTGGFCWWQTHTSNYGIRETPWKGGKGDVLAELSASCRRHGLALGVYVYPGDDQWGAGIGSGGRTKDPLKQAAYNKVFRKQMTEVLSRYGNMREVWFDGSCVIDVSDILAKYAPNAVIFQGPCATIRWVGTESGRAPYPAWNSLMRADLKTGTSTAAQGNPNGNAWAPLECDTPLYNHFWFWSPNGERHRKSLNELMDIYYKSVGHGAVLLLNSTPDTNGLIPEADMKLYAAFGKEIARRFDHPVAAVEDRRGDSVEITLAKPAIINTAIEMEDYRQGERIRKYVVEGFNDGTWNELCAGTAVGRKKIDAFPSARVSRVRLRVTGSVAEPLIRSFAVFNTARPLASDPAPAKLWRVCARWSGGPTNLVIDLTKFIPAPGQFEVKFQPDDLEITDAKLYFNGSEAAPGQITRLAQGDFNISQTQAVTAETRTELHVRFRGAWKGTVSIRERL